MKKLYLSAVFAAFFALVFAACENPVVTPEEGTAYPIRLTSVGNGTATVTIDGVAVTEAKAGAIVSLAATPDEGYALEKWVTKTSGVTFENAAAVSTIFVMPARGISLEARFVDENSMVDALPAITDPGFKAYCENAMANQYQYMNTITGEVFTHPAWDSNSDGILSITEAAAVKSIDVSRTGTGADEMAAINSLAGIEIFTGLEFLSCSSQDIASLDVSKNKALISLWWSHTPLTTLDLSENSSLFVLSCSFNQLTTLNLTGCPALKTLTCNNNKLTTLDLSKNTSLGYLQCGNNPLTALDVTKNVNLYTLYCNSNGLTALDVSKNTGLIYLNCAGNTIGSLDLSANETLSEINCSSNQLTSLVAPGNDNHVFQMLGCSNNLLTTLDLSGSAALAEVNCADNLLTTLDVTGCVTLSGLRCQNNRITAIPGIADSPLLFRIYAFNNRLTALDISRMPTIQEGLVYHAYCGKQTSDGTTPQTITLTIRAEQEPYWNHTLANDASNSGAQVTIKN